MKTRLMTVHFQLEGQDFVALNGGPHFKFTEAISFVVNRETQPEFSEKRDSIDKIVAFN